MEVLIGVLTELCLYSLLCPCRAYLVLILLLTMMKVSFMPPGTISSDSTNFLTEATSLSKTSWICPAPTPSLQTNKQKTSLQSKLLRLYRLKLESINYQPKFDKFSVSFCQFKPISPYQAENDTEKMVSISFQVNIYWLLPTYTAKTDIKW